MTTYLTISTTTDDRGVAQTIARAAIERRLGACARIFEVESHFRWEGEVQSAREFAVEIKTTSRRREKLEAMISELHAYELPEIVVHEIVGGSRAYLDWISSETGE